ncbi:hypothetical protein [Sphingomonas sp. RS2018]
MRRLTLAIVPATLLLAACGGGQDIVVTNENNVLLNDAQANFAVTNDGEMSANDMAEMNAMDANMMTMNETTPATNAM